MTSEIDDLENHKFDTSDYIKIDSGVAIYRTKRIKALEEKVDAQDELLREISQSEARGIDWAREITSVIGESER